MATELKNNEAALVAQWDEDKQEYFLTLALPSEEEFATTPLPDAFLLLTALFLKVHNDPEFVASVTDEMSDSLEAMVAAETEENIKAAMDAAAEAAVDLAARNFVEGRQTK